MLSKFRVGTAALAAAAMRAASSVAAVPTAQAGPGIFGGVEKPSSVELVKSPGKKWRGGRYYRGAYRGPYRGYRGCWNCGGPGWWGPGIGFGTGLVVGSLLATPRYYAPRAYYAPRPVYRGYAYSSRDALCARKYRSYNPVTNTYVGYDGRRHYCRL